MSMVLITTVKIGAVALGSVMFSLTCFPLLTSSLPCPVCENANVADIVFLVDGSTSIGPTSFQEVRNFLRGVINAFDIGFDRVRIGLAQYSDEPHQEFLLKDHTDKSSLLTAVENIPYRTGNTFTGKAMDFIREQYFTEVAGSRDSQRVPQIAVVITDGDSADDVKEPARLLRQKGVIVFGIGVGQANLMELQSIANQPSDHFLLTIDSYQALQKLTDRLLRTVCISVEDQRQGEAKDWMEHEIIACFLICNQIQKYLSKMNS